MDFSDKLAALCAKEVTEARGDADRMSEMLERLSRVLGVTIAEVAHGNPRGVDSLMPAVEAYIHEGAVDHAPRARLMARVRNGARG